jgi:hypothetical protein
MRERDRHQLVELGDQTMDAVGRHIEPKQFDGDESIAIRIVRTKDRSQCASADLMENPKWTERLSRRATVSFRVQWKTPQEGDSS